eukprot:CAMPEP_0201499428 /NCGR_PEP_ID=MMETSP0151_2-20130828/76031_1 /ASSEMBLY_ACC=CAM_ASM_000257 /TAXON_ID=200890 /ORGANISM="Paramoeba atlantica, Strain 621/1 / CCAP 1560/9" /LENGTH=81 /DNA_ID=CAMNT_0047891737 /DNA_START=132 /DNA_END=378 /DNA_ORIENTATION=+
MTHCMIAAASQSFRACVPERRNADVCFPQLMRWMILEAIEEIEGEEISGEINGEEEETKDEEAGEEGVPDEEEGEEVGEEL